MHPIEAQLRRVLPPLDSQKCPLKMVLYARLASDEGDWCCYVAEGSEVDGRYLIRGWFLGAVEVWHVKPLVDVIEHLSQEGFPIHLDEHFEPRNYENLRLERLGKLA